MLSAAETEKPGKGVGLYLVPYESDGIYSIWGKPATGGEPEKYLVQARKVNGGAIHRKWVDADTCGYLFEDLDAGETYEGRIRAANEIGRGPVCVNSITPPAE